MKRTARGRLNNLRTAVSALAITALLGAAPALAADLVVEEAPAAPSIPMEEPPVASWAGPYLGITAGYGFSGKVGTGEGTVDTDGVVAGAFAGYQWQNDAFVYGLEGDIGYSGVDGRDDGVDTDGGVEGSLRARLGYSVMPDILIYGTGGVAAQKLEVSVPGSADEKGMVGYTVGAGTDVKLTEKVFGRVEYRYTDFGEREFDFGSGSQDVDSSNHRVIFGVGMSF